MEAKEQALQLLGHLKRDNAKRRREPANVSELSPEERQALAKRADFMVSFWEKMANIFGQPWENNYGTAEGSAIATWTSALSIYSETSIRAAVDLMKAWTKPFPPTLGEFAEVCRQYRPAWDSGKALTHSPRAPREVAERELKKMKAILKGRYPETTDEALERLGRKR